MEAKFQTIRKIFEDQTKKDEIPYIGLEAEKSGLDAQTGTSPKYTGKKGYLAILGKMYEELGWEIKKQEGKYILQMQRCGAFLNLESDGRIELAGDKYESVHDLAREFRIHQNEVMEISKVFGIIWLGVGYHPVSANSEIEDMPDERKEMIVKFFTKIKEDTGNDFGLAWFKKTAGIHCNIDYFSEEDFAYKAKVFTRLAPILTAMFANSPFSRGQFTGYMSYRYNVTLKNNISRFETSKELYESAFGFDDWINHVLSLPILFLKKGDEWIEPKMSFQEYMTNGFEGHQATMDDFEMHTKSLWKDVKLKNVIELRCFDSLPPSLVPSVAALIKGLAYSQTALDSVWEIVKDLNYFEHKNLQQDVAKNGLQATLKGEKVLDIAKKLINIAEKTLQTDKVLDAFGRDESVFLEPIKEYIFVKEKSPAEWLVHQWEGEWRNSFFPVFEWCQY